MTSTEEIEKESARKHRSIRQIAEDYQKEHFPNVPVRKETPMQFNDNDMPLVHVGTEPTMLQVHERVTKTNQGGRGGTVQHETIAPYETVTWSDDSHRVSMMDNHAKRQLINSLESQGRILKSDIAPAIIAEISKELSDLMQQVQESGAELAAIRAERARKQGTETPCDRNEEGWALVDDECVQVSTATEPAPVESEAHAEAKSSPKQPIWGQIRKSYSECKNPSCRMAGKKHTHENVN